MLTVIVIKMRNIANLDEVLSKMDEIKKANPNVKITIEIDLGDD